MNIIHAPISVGELLDKISILEIKLVNTTNENKIFNIQNELNILRNLYFELSPELNKLYYKLKQTNQFIWNVEGRIRELEKQQNFGQEFIDSARSIYINNDLRASIKKEINTISESYVVEEKCYD